MATSSYFLPAIFLNPVVILHSMNTYFSYRFPPISTLSTSHHPTMEKYGPLPGSMPFFDVHGSENLCWTYTLIMVFAQLFAYTNISSRRLRKKSKLRRDGKDIKHSRWSEAEESPKMHLDASRAQKRKERAEMDEEERRRGSSADEGTVDEGPPTGRQVRLIRSQNRNGAVLTGDLPSEVAEKVEEDEDIEIADSEEEDEEYDESSETSDEVMII